MKLTPLEQNVLKLLNKTEEEYLKEAAEHSANTTTKVDVNNLGDTVVDLLILINDLKTRIEALEGGTSA